MGAGLAGQAEEGMYDRQKGTMACDIPVLDFNGRADSYSAQSVDATPYYLESGT